MKLDLKNTGTTLLDSNWFYLLDLVLKNTRTTLLDLNWLYLFMIYWTWTRETLSTRTTSLDFLLNTGLELINQPSKDVVTYVWRLSWMNCFLPFNIVIHADFTPPSFGMMISPSTLLRFLCSFGYCMSLSHMSITHLECFPMPFCSVTNYVQRDSPNTVKFNFPISDIAWFEKPNVNVVK